MKTAMSGVPQPLGKMLEGLFAKVEWRRDGTDLHVTLALDDGHVGTLFGLGGVVPYFLLGRDVAVAPVQVAPAPVPVEQAKPESRKTEPQKRE